ncbi:MAG: DUF5318 family protein [Candidatus Nanopelagicales bacterium]
MAAPRTNSIRGSRRPGTGRPARPPRPDPGEFAAENVDDPRKPRSVISYALSRRAALGTLAHGRILDFEHCDADPNLLRAARFHGEPTNRICPVCRKVELVNVNWAFGAQLGASSGGAHSTSELQEMAGEFGRFRVYTVEVCPGCSWNFLHTAYDLGDGRAAPDRSRGGGLT